MAQSQTVQFLSPGGLNPTWAGPCPSRNSCSNPPSGGLRSQRRAATSGDEGARQGQSGRGRSPAVWWCQAPSRAEALGSSTSLRRRASRLFPPARPVLGGVTRSQWPTTLTGESPTPFRARPGQPRPISLRRNGPGHAAARGRPPDVRVRGWQLLRSSADPDGVKGDTVVRRSRSTDP